MMPLAYFAAFLAVLLLTAAGQSWWRVANGGQQPLGARRVRMAATATALAFWLLAFALAVVLFEQV